MAKLMLPIPPEMATSPHRKRVHDKPFPSMFRLGQSAILPGLGLAWEHRLIVIMGRPFLLSTLRIVFPRYISWLDSRDYVEFRRPLGCRENYEAAEISSPLRFPIPESCRFYSPVQSLRRIRLPLTHPRPLLSRASTHHGRVTTLFF